jgi:hypothetical protein
MPLPSPNLDDRDFEQMLAEVRRRIQQTCPEWTDLSAHDPGTVLLELFVHLTETMIYRLNRLPEKVYVELLRLIGVQLHPPTAATVRLRFSRSQSGDQPVEIPRGAQVTLTSGQDPVTFVTARTVTIQAGKEETEVLAHHCDLVEGELAGVGTSLAGLTVSARRPPLVAPTGDELDLMVGVEARESELSEHVSVIRYRGKIYRIWREVESFTNLGQDRFVYTANRADGLIMFAPAARLQQIDTGLEENPQALAEIPQAGREIRLWYRRGGGPQGNVAAHTLTVLKTPIVGVDVTNPDRATGGRAAETLENALIRGPQELHSLHRAVTARDFEGVALNSSQAIARAKALTRADLWIHATPGTVEVLLVPSLSDGADSAPASAHSRVSEAELRKWETETARLQIQESLDERRPLGTTCLATWTRYKTVRVTARVVVGREQEQGSIRQRVIDRLHNVINPLPTPLNLTGWPFGQALRISQIYDMILAEPGVRWADRVKLMVDQVPERTVNTVAADLFQPRTWYAGSADTLFRSMNDGDGWEPAGHFADEEILLVEPHTGRAGLLAVVTLLKGRRGSRIHVSADCGESWSVAADTSFRISDLAWLLRNDTPVLLLASDVGLFELPIRTGSTPVQVLVSSQNQDQGFYAVVATRDLRGQVSVAVAAQATAGLFLSNEGGRSNTFRHIGLRNEDIRVLEVQYDGPRAFLWAGAAAAGGDDAGRGCFRWEVRGSEDPPEGWQRINQGWNGGSCRAIAFRGSQILASTHRSGVLFLTRQGSEARWEAPDVNCGLPLRDPGRFYPVDTVAADPGGRLILAGGIEGVYRSEDGGRAYASASSKEFSDRVTLPPTWLFCSGEHQVTVVSEDEAERD